jgi:hypothetical protein
MEGVEGSSKTFNAMISITAIALTLVETTGSAF